MKNKRDHEIVLCRHAETQLDVENRLRGRADPSLSTRGARQAEALAAAFDPWPPSVVVSSPRRRALETAVAIARRQRVAVSVDKRPGTPAGLYALLGAGAVLAATTQGRISTVVLLMELTGRDRSFILPLLIAVGTATLIARSIEPRSIYDARLTDEEIEKRRKLRDAQMAPMTSGAEQSLESLPRE